MIKEFPAEIAGVVFKNPIIAASGTAGFGRELSKFYPLSTFGGISCKGLTLQKRDGNPPPRITETPGGMLNAVGLQNPGVEAFIQEELPWLGKQETVVIANIAGFSLDEYRTIAERLSDTAVDMLELNISCPNVKDGGLHFGATPQGVEEVTSSVRAVCKKPLIVKLTPNTADITETARAAEASGADAITLINTLTGMRIDIKTGKPILGNITGGLSGGAIFPVALRMIWQSASCVSIPILGSGGVSSAEEALEMLLAGASLVQIGTVIFSDPYAPVKITAGLKKYLEVK